MRRRSESAEEPAQRQTLLRPPDKPLKQRVRDFFWERDKKTCLTRTPKNWLSITIYYFIFLAVVVVIFLISVYVVYKTAENEGRPQYILKDSPIGETPALNFFPLTEERPLIRLSSKKFLKIYVDLITTEFNKYKEIDKGFSTKDFGDCKEPPFGYDKNTPCIFFRLNRLIMWKPIPYKSGDALPNDIPADVKSLIMGSSTPKIWMHCNGTTAKDRDHITQDFFQMQGSKGFDTSVFPYDGQKAFVDPIVAMKLTDNNPKKMLYSFSCSAWSKKIESEKSVVDIVYFFE